MALGETRHQCHVITRDQGLRRMIGRMLVRYYNPCSAEAYPCSAEAYSNGEAHKQKYKKKKKKKERCITM